MTVRTAGLLLFLVAAGCGPDLSDLPEVAPRGQTEPVTSAGDAADDAAIWVNPVSPEESLILGTDKKAGVHLYALDGRSLQFLPLGETNNIDLRPDFPFPDRAAPIVAVSNRSDGTVTLLRLDDRARRLVPVPVGLIPANFEGGEQVSGVCLYHPAEGVYHVAVTGKEGALRQWQLEPEPGGTVKGDPVRSIRFGSTTEACVFDDALGLLYVAEEDVGLWRLPADPGPESETARRLVDRVWPHGELQAHVEGVDIYARDDGTGYLLVSSQGRDLFHVYRREGENAFVGGFRIGDSSDGRIDGVTHTDGLAITSAPLGPNWPAGLLVVQDDRGPGPKRNQNFKLVGWTDVMRALGH